MSLSGGLAEQCEWTDRVFSPENSTLGIKEIEFALRKTDRLAKQMLDLFVAAFSLVLFSPLLLLIAVCIKIDSRGPVLFRSVRIGKNGEPIHIFKFRTMVINAGEILEKSAELNKEFASSYKIRNDFRVTRFGKFLRRTCLDELPQVINIFRGEMSFVGPRPILPEEYSRTPFERFTVLPGLTGLWQVNGKNAVSYERKCELDIEYTTSRDLWLDLKILVLTVPAIIKGIGFF